jgi:TatA/E family protein of Tat protein translocase
VFNLGMGEITVILLLALIFLGPSKLPDLASGLGKLIKEIRKATSDVKNEIALDDSFRKPFEELRDAVTLHPDELKRRDQWRKDSEEAAKRAADDLARAEADKGPPDGLVSPVSVQGVSHPDLSPTPDGEPRPGPNDTIVQTAPPRGATLDDIPTPPPEVPLAAAKPTGRPARLTPAGVVARPETLRNMKPLGTPAARPAAPPAPPPAPGASSAATAAPPTAPAAPSAAPAAPRPAPAAPSAAPAAPSAAPAAPAASANSDNAANITQILKEEDLIPTFSSGKPPPPPHLPGLRPVGPAVPRPGVASPSPSTPADKKKP